LATESGIETPTREQLARLDRKRKKRTSNQEWMNPHDPDAKVAKMKHGSTHLGHKAEHAVDLETGAVEKLNLPAGNSYRFTPDGRSIFYSRSSDGNWGPNDIYLYDLKSGESRTIVEHPADDLAIGILPGTDWFLFASDRRGSVDLWGVRFREGRAVGEPLLIKQLVARRTRQDLLSILLKLRFEIPLVFRSRFARDVFRGRLENELARPVDVAAVQVDGRNQGFVDRPSEVDGCSRLATGDHPGILYPGERENHLCNKQVR
jgi:hypothetical protein